MGRKRTRQLWVESERSACQQTAVFDNLRFQTRFLRARFREIAGDFAGAAKLLEHGVTPPRRRSLRDAYRVRMLVLAEGPESGPSIIKTAENLSWFRNPQSAEDEYARIYCKYLLAGVRGETIERKRHEAVLALLKVRKIYRGSLKIVRVP